LGRGGPYSLSLANPDTDPSLEGTSYGSYPTADNLETSIGFLY